MQSKGATLQQSSNIFPRKLLSFQGNKEYLDLFYQKLVEIYSVGGCGEEKAPKIRLRRIAG
ncbi:hypothetical protein COT77_02235 [Candidatus Berkelbacteria bacterium CG10_big_fil_rev_8_21_14_0_10_41_12]|uniref:Uncharacterized protein n=1 Tax=Candidatus Berkelbacteria bacterium CG10_big_fil_rev_8_21_14_0_10_41_12 TaxID=1974513 RepID=A0A2M6WWX6_9BACT|nr:MAG: hypothetical protein COT77_02235 [Candidatus Berkelbacteria bacterium CG10_big_fil_rev_8_21_14_0_10_41_12]